MKYLYGIILLLVNNIVLAAPLDRAGAIKKLNEINSNGTLSEVEKCKIQYKSNSGFREIVDFTKPVTVAEIFLKKSYSKNDPMDRIYIRYTFSDKNAVKYIDELGPRYSDKFEHMLGFQMKMLPKDFPLNKTELNKAFFSSHAWRRITYWCVPEMPRYVNKTKYKLAW